MARLCARVGGSEGAPLGLLCTAPCRWRRVGTRGAALTVFPAEQHRAAATAAVDVTNLLVNPGTRVPAYSLFTHSKKPTTKDLAGNIIETGRHAHLQEKQLWTSYYEQLEAMSPAAPAAPSETRSYSSSVASRANTSVTTSESRTPAETVYSTPREEMTATQINNASAAAHVRAAAHRMEHEQLCQELASAIAAEDFRRANELKAKRDELRSRAPDSGMMSSSACSPAPTPRTGGFMTPAKSTTSYVDARRPSDSGGLGFLMTVFKHNPEHTPTPDAYFHA
jgi:hypothetical protein